MGWRKVQILPSAARTALVAYTQVADEIPNTERIIVAINVTVLTAGASITPTLSGNTPLPAQTADNPYTLLTGAAIVATGLTILEVGPGCTAVANLVSGRAVPPKWGFSMAVADSKSVTYSVSAWIYERD